MDLTEYVNLCGTRSEAHGWHDHYTNLLIDGQDTVEHVIAKTALVGCEVSEAIEELRNGHKVDELYWNGEKPEGYGVELADVVIRVFDLAYMLDLDLEEIIRTKLDANLKRGHMHGGKLV